MIKTINGQPFELVRTSVYARRNGGETFLLTWRSHCAICDEPFETQTLGLGLPSVPDAG